MFAVVRSDSLVRLFRPLHDLIERRTPRLIILIGASGAGKTTIARRCRELNGDLPVFHFDQFKIPPGYTRREDHDSWADWQHDMSHVWLRMLRDRPEPVILFEGQMMVASVIEAVRASDVRDVRIVLVDCADDIRKRRLIGRGHPQLISKMLVERAREFRRDAQAKRLMLLRSDLQTAEDGARRILGYCRLPLIHRLRRKFARTRGKVEGMLGVSEWALTDLIYMAPVASI